MLARAAHRINTRASAHKGIFDALPTVNTTATANCCCCCHYYYYYYYYNYNYYYYCYCYCCCYHDCY